MILDIIDLIEDLLLKIVLFCLLKNNFNIGYANYD